MRHVILLGLSALALASCIQPAPDPSTGATTYTELPLGVLIARASDVRGLYKVCNMGRAIYYITSASGGGMAIVEDAPECQRDVMPVASNNPPPTED